jgi:hypothetical protein
VTLLVGRRTTGERLRPSGHRREPDLVDRHAVEHPLVDPVGGPFDPWHLVAEPLGHPLHPHIRRLGDVGVGVVDPTLTSCFGHARTVLLTPRAALRLPHTTRSGPPPCRPAARRGG